jgi:hypothetical protein
MRWIHLAVYLISIAIAPILFGQDTAAVPRDVQSDTWVATDSLGRSLSSSTRHPRKNRYVGIFYFMVHGTRAKHDTAVGPYDRADKIFDNTAILARLHGDLGADSPAYMDAYKTRCTYWWAQPAVGYFLADDAWVHRRNLKMLGEAGVDVIFIDATNAVLYHDAEDALFSAAQDLMAQGIATPKIAYVLHSHMAQTAQRVYDRFYADGMYRNLWFNWLGKPLIMASAQTVIDGKPQTVAPELRDFFTWRESWAWTSKTSTGGSWFGDGHDKWPWLDDYPQNFGWHESKDKPEEVAVTIAGHPTTDLGRSFRGGRGNGAEPALNAEQLSPDTGSGHYFAQQWKRAIDLDPQFVFVTGWNEWYATRFAQKPPYTELVGNLHLPYFFVDEYNAEFSRDAMPVRGGFGDNYYLQLVEGIRQFKGARAAPTATTLNTINSSEDFIQWNNVKPDYLNNKGDTAGRDWPGWGKEYYRVPAKRNNIILSKVACDANTVAFYVQTAEPISAPDGKTWMQLLVDTDQNHRTGWQGYDYLINRTQPRSNQASVERWTDRGWESAGTASMKVNGRELMIVVPRQLMALPSAHGTSIDFHWLDDVSLPADPVDFWYRGESAPDGRFNYRYSNTGDGTVRPSSDGPSPLALDPSTAQP